MFNRPQFPLPEIVHPEKTRCIQIHVPDEPTYIQVLVGLIHQQTQWFNWMRDPEKKGKEVAQVWKKLFNEIDWSDMSCCCPETPPVQYKYIGTVLYRSTDGGTTFEPAPEYDYRNTSTQWPKPSEIGVPSTKCQAADSVVQTFRDQINQQITEDMGATAILGVIAAVLLLFLSAGTSAAISAQVVAVVAAILGAGVTTWQAAFTTEVWDQFRCLIYNNMSDDESIDQTGLDDLYSQLDTTFTGIVVPTLKGYIAAAGLVGINNMMASNSGDPDATCCPDCNADNWDIVTYSGTNVGILVSRTSNTITVQGTGHPDFGTPYNAMIQTMANDICCVPTAIELISGTMPLYFGVECGNPRWPGSPNGPVSVGVSNVNTIYLRGDTDPFVAKITFA